MLGDTVCAMASTLEGFDGQLAVGTVTGLRAWQDYRRPERVVSPGEPIEITPMGSPYPTYIQGPPRMVPDPARPPRLYGMWGGTWEPGQNVAACSGAGAMHATVPHEKCGCGFWAYWSKCALPRGIFTPGLAGVIEG